eukprot:TRINITY_DN5058_c0_g2_i1.p1 TRINITY_DN5058_c0_g2~~TRINITY_DN5058_c0_g2_i1.p1  ORF type:complete len:274 (-),score=48.89 TRINITY_DN5058_c0_g2_i1:604-1425(-)
MRHRMQVSKAKALECYLPFKLFRSQSTEPSYRNSVVRVDRSATSMAYHEIEQKHHFVSETGQSMGGFHAAKCRPVRLASPNDIYQMETLTDLMRKHKEAFTREYDEFGPVCEWTPDESSPELPVSEGARELGKHFDLRGELATIQHVRRAQSRNRNPSPMLQPLSPRDTQASADKSRGAPPHENCSRAHKQQVSPFLVPLPAISGALLGGGSVQSTARSFVSNASQTATPAPEVSLIHPHPDDRYPSSLQFLYLPPARSGIAVVDTTAARQLY